jgi:site-specific DNA recombinase
MNPVKAAAIYARISSDQDGTALGVARQVQDCAALAKSLGWVVAEEYVDNDLSAFSGKRRPSYERMLADLRDRTRDAVLVYHADRLTRRPVELEQFLAVVTEAGVGHVRFASGADVDIANGDGLMVLRLLAAVAANESASKSRRVRRKLDENAALGRPHGGSRRPFGYEPDKVTVRADEAEIVRALVARYLAGESLRSVTAWLEAEGVSTVSGKPWSTTTVRAILASGRIAGLRDHHGRSIGLAVWKPIISESDHGRIQARMAQQKVSGRAAAAPLPAVGTASLRALPNQAVLLSPWNHTTLRLLVRP